MSASKFITHDYYAVRTSAGIEIVPERICGKISNQNAAEFFAPHIEGDFEHCVFKRAGLESFAVTLKEWEEATGVKSLPSDFQYDSDTPNGWRVIPSSPDIPDVSGLRNLRDFVLTETYDGFLHLRPLTSNK